MAVSVQTVADAIIDAGMSCRVVGDPLTEVSNTTHDSRSVRPGVVFACLRGAAFDGHEFARAAIEQGATALLVDHELVGEHGGASDAGSVVAQLAVTQLVVEDTRRAVGPAAAAVLNHPSRKLDSVGITGTNGKTTTAQLVAWILDGVGWSPGVVGTLHGPRTTPEATDLQSMLAAFVADGKRSVVMEVSSHALALHRVDGTSFDVVAFTNFGHDHLDLHGTPEEYFRAKSELFDIRFAPRAVINVDDPHGRLLADAVAARSGTAAMEVIEIGMGDVTHVAVEPGAHRYRWRGVDVEVPLGGDFNVANSLMALTIATTLGVEATAAAAALADLPPVPGRFELVESAGADERGIGVIVDYAHTPDGLDELLRAARNITAAGGHVIVVFGCGGERDRDKRGPMGEVASRLADRVVVTSDNPRREDPGGIIDDILAGVPERYRARTMFGPDRRAAIAVALDAARRSDIVVIAGRGHERTQDLGDITIDFDDRAVARELLDRGPHHSGVRESEDTP